MILLTSPLSCPTIWAQQALEVNWASPMGRLFQRKWRRRLRRWPFREKCLSPSRPMREHILSVLRSESLATRLIMSVKAELRASIENTEAERALLVAAEELKDWYSVRAIWMARRRLLK